MELSRKRLSVFVGVWAVLFSVSVSAGSEATGVDNIPPEYEGMLTVEQLPPFVPGGAMREALASPPQKVIVAAALPQKVESKVVRTRIVSRPVGAVKKSVKVVKQVRQAAPPVSNIVSFQAVPLLSKKVIAGKSVAVAAPPPGVETKPVVAPQISQTKPVVVTKQNVASKPSVDVSGPSLSAANTKTPIDITPIRVIANQGWRLPNRE